MKIYIHIGTHKTGSTSIQNVLFNNKELLIKQGVYYPNVIDKHTGQHHLAWMLVNNKFDDANDYLTKELVIAEDLGCHSIVLSSEEFEFLNNLERISFFKKYGDVSIIVLFRRQDDFLEAEYSQSVKMPIVRYSKDMYTFFIEKNFSSRLNYEHIMQNWIKVYGVKSTNIISYDLERKNKSLLPNFFKLLSLNINDFSVDKLYAANVSLPNKALIYLARLNNMNDVSTEKHIAAINFLSEKFKNDKATFIDSELRESLLERYKQMNLKLLQLSVSEYNANFLDIIKSDKRTLINHFEDFDIAIFNELLEHLGLIS